MPSLKLAAFRPEIAANLGAMIRVSACFGAALHVIEPCGFPWRRRDIDRVALDYGPQADPVRHASWDLFRSRCHGRLILLTTKAVALHTDLAFAPGDILLVGQESAGVPADIAAQADRSVRIRMATGARSLNVAIAAAVALGEARRQIGWD
jgi:tRNA (cytidine/uridine-2'-O-)-methyltransferase